MFNFSQDLINEVRTLDWNISYIQDMFFTFLLLVVVILITLGCHDFKQSLEDAAKVAGIVGLQLISNTCIMPEHIMDISMRETKRRGRATIRARAFTWYANKEAVDEVAAAVEARSDLVPGSHLGILQGQLDLLMVQIFWRPRAGGQTADRAGQGDERQDKIIFQNSAGTIYILN